MDSQVSSSGLGESSGRNLTGDRKIVRAGADIWVSKLGLAEWLGVLKAECLTTNENPGLGILVNKLMNELTCHCYIAFAD